MTENIEKNKKMMEYAIHTNEIEGYEYTDTEKTFLMSVAEEKITVEEAIKSFLNK